jgi:hypothetical protein
MSTGTGFRNHWIVLIQSPLTASIPLKRSIGLPHDGRKRFSCRHYFPDMRGIVSLTLVAGGTRAFHVRPHVRFQLDQGFKVEVRSACRRLDKGIGSR